MLHFFQWVNFSNYILHGLIFTGIFVFPEHTHLTLRVKGRSQLFLKKKKKGRMKKAHVDHGKATDHMMLWKWSCAERRLGIL